MTEEKIKQLEVQVQALTAMNTQLAANTYEADNDIDLKELWNTIWSGKLQIIAITAIFAIASVFYAFSIPDEYKSTILLAPATSSSSSSLSKLAGQFGGLASLAGINLDAGGAEDKTVVAMEIMKTWDFIETFIKENQIEVEVFAAEGWNRSSNQLLIDSDLYDQTNKIWVRDFDASEGQKAEPSSWELFEEIEDRINISQDKQSELISLSVEYYSPIIAKEWADRLLKAINSYIQKQDREEATKNIIYLNKKIQETNITDMQSVFYQLIEEQTKTLMLAEVSDEYVFKTLSPAKVAEEESKPERALIVVFGFMLGGMLAFMIVLVRHFKKNN